MAGEKFFEGMPGPEATSPIVRLVEKDGQIIEKPSPFTQVDYLRLSPNERNQLHSALQSTEESTQIDPIDQIGHSQNHNGLNGQHSAQKAVGNLEV